MGGKRDFEIEFKVMRSVRERGRKIQKTEARSVILRNGKERMNHGKKAIKMNKRSL